jgi:two-component system sensor histidine kinase ChiS
MPIVTKAENGEIVDPKKPKTVVLVVDDEESVLGVTSIVLNSLGFEVITANCGVDGLNALKLHHKKIDVVLLDVMMPDIYGIDLLKTIKEDANLKSIPILMYSGISDEKEMQKAIDLGAEGCIDKTSSKEEILRMLIKYTL